MVKVSIIIPIYNSATSLQRCLDSILLQTYSNWEAILINDGSSDASLNICEMYVEKDSRFRLFDIPNGGVSHARNVGLTNASGEYITFVDSDDYICKNYLSESLVSLSELIVTNYEKPRYLVQDIYVEKQLDILFKQIAFRTVWAKFFLNRIIKELNLRFDENIRFAEDTLFVLSYTKHISSVTYVFKQLYIYIKPQYQSVAKYKTSLEDYLEIMGKLQDFSNDLERKSYDVTRLKEENTDALCWPYMIFLYTSNEFSYKERYKYYNLFKKKKQTKTDWCLHHSLLPLFYFANKFNCFLLIDLCFKINFMLINIKHTVINK